MSEITKKQHYVSQCVIRRFADSEEKLYEALLEQEKVIPSNSRKSMVENYTYEHPSLDRNALENYFGKYETEMGVVLVDLQKKLTGYESGDVDMQDIRSYVIKHMPLFILFYYKSGALLHEFQVFLEEEENRIILMLKKIMDSTYMKQLSATIAQHYRFAVIKSSWKDFLLSDQYLNTASLSLKPIFPDATNRSIGFKDVIILIPVSAEYYLVFYDGDVPFGIVADEFNDLTNEQVQIVNRVIINNSYKKALALNKEPLESAMKAFKTESPVGAASVFAGGKSIGNTKKKEVFFTEELEELWNEYSGWRWTKHYEKLDRNEACYCGSGKKLKKCCLEKVSIMRDVLQKTRQSPKALRTLLVHPKAIIEKPIAEFR